MRLAWDRSAARIMDLCTIHQPQCSHGCTTEPRYGICRIGIRSPATVDHGLIKPFSPALWLLVALAVLELPL
eukprot:scaffold400233_cov29-Prasinocladus_malaysianus.AAC.1